MLGGDLLEVVHHIVLDILVDFHHLLWRFAERWCSSIVLLCILILLLVWSFAESVVFFISLVLHLLLDFSSSLWRFFTEELFFITLALLHLHLDFQLLHCGGLERGGGGGVHKTCSSSSCSSYSLQRGGGFHHHLDL